MPIISSAADVEAALFSASLAPAAPSSKLRDGATARLRHDMARFTSGDDHTKRRIHVDRLVGIIDTFPFAGDATRRTLSALAGGAVDAVSDIAFVVPVETMASALNVAEADLKAVGSDVLAITKVIGRGEPSSQDADDATARLEARFGGPGHDATAPISLLYQTHDATAALFATSLLAELTSTIRRPAVSATARVVTEPIEFSQTRLLPGEMVTINLEAARLEFGAGIHRCPGRTIAERMVAGMLHAFVVADVEIDPTAIGYGVDERPTSIPLG